MFEMDRTGDVWRDANDREFLILKDNGRFCTTLILHEMQSSNTFAVDYGRVRFAAPMCVSYVKDSQLCGKIGHVDDWKWIVEACVRDFLGVLPDMASPKNSGGTTMQEEQLHEENNRLRRENVQLELYKTLYQQLLDRVLPMNGVAR